MAASFSVNTLQVDFESVLAMEHSGMLSENFSLKVEVIAGTIVNSVANRKLALSKGVFAATFGLPTEGVDGFLDVPKETVNEMRSRFSDSRMPFRAPSKKKGMKMEYCLLHDNVAKALCAKAGSFDMVTSEKFDLMVSISSGLKKNLKVTPAGESSKQIKDTASNTEGGESQIAQIEGQAPSIVEKEKGASQKKKGETTAVENKKQKLAKKMVPSQTVEARSGDAPADSSSQPSLELDSRPWVGQNKKGGTKRKQVVESPDSESTISLPIKDFAKKQMMQRHKKQMKLGGGHERPDSKQHEHAGGDNHHNDRHEENPGCKTQPDHGVPDENVSNNTQGEREPSTVGGHEGGTTEMDEWFEKDARDEQDNPQLEKEVDTIERALVAQEKEQPEDVQRTMEQQAPANEDQSQTDSSFGSSGRFSIHNEDSEDSFCIHSDPNLSESPTLSGCFLFMMSPPYSLGPNPPSAANSNTDHQGPRSSEMQLVVYIEQHDNIDSAVKAKPVSSAVSEPLDPPTLQFMDTTAKTLTTLTDRVSSLDLMYARMRDDTNLTRHYTTQLRDQLTNVTGLSCEALRRELGKLE
ncbi:hypothetical protein F511_34121 [Dorcoceras hygrometricum]|uniref:Uncharacterized protein n=1 Tax=Dorcoceras hygrometricum TaxID=472368 RepID=A0A2Z7CC68_9LAMI|nr:hypothetical protein F511_34121 [Dorcoceras hygrometricum]